MISTPCFDLKYPRALLFFLIICFFISLPLLSEDAQLGGESILVPFVLSGSYQGEILLLVEENETYLSYEQLLEYIEETLSTNGMDCLGGQEREDRQNREMISLSNLRQCGLDTEFREKTLDVWMEIPPEMKKEQSISLRGRAPDYSGTVLEPAGLSGWLNSNLIAKYSYENSDFLISENLAGGVNFHSWVLDLDMTVSNGTAPFVLNHARVIKDIPLLSSRLEAGDLSYSTYGIDGVNLVTGLSLVRNFDMKPEIQRKPVGEQTLFLQTDSLVQVEVNGKIVKELELPAGFYRLENFGLAQGVNKIRILVANEEGQKEEAVYFPLSASLLRTGEIDFGLAAGIPDRTIGLPLLAAYLRAGVTDSLTVELKELGALSTRQLYVEFSGVSATRLGNMSLKAAFSLIPEVTTEFILLGQYQYSRPFKPEAGSFGGAFNYDMVVQDEDPENAGLYSLSLSAYYMKPFPGSFSITPSVLYSLGNDRDKTFRAKTLFRKGLGGGSSLSFDMAYKWSEADGPVMEGTISFSTAFPDYNQTLMVQQDLGAEKFFFNWNRFPGGSTGLDLNTSLQVPFDPEERSTYNLGAGYTLPVAALDFRHRVVTVFDFPEETLNTSQLSLSNALVYAGKTVGFTRAVRDSFVLVRADEPLKEEGVLVNPSGNSQAAVAGKSHGVLTGPAAYRAFPVRIEVRNLPPGVDLSESQYVFKPGFRSGALITAKLQNSVYSGGRLVDRKGEPFSYALGEISLSGAPGEKENTSEPIDFFTDEKGTFEIYNLFPGIWEINLLNLKTGKLFLTIPENTFGYYFAGDIKEDDHD